MSKLTKNIICFHRNLSNNKKMALKLNHSIIKNDDNIILLNDNLKEVSPCNFKSNNNYYILNGHINELNTNTKKKYTNTNNLYSWIHGVTKLSAKSQIIEYNAYINDYHEVNHDIFDNILNISNNNKIKFDCAIGFSHGIFPTAVMLQQKLIKNAIIICPQTIKGDDIFENIKDCNILCISGAKDYILNDSLKSYIELQKNNNCELFITNKGHQIPQNKKDDIISFEALKKIHKFIENC